MGSGTRRAAPGHAWIRRNLIRGLAGCVIAVLFAGAWSVFHRAPDRRLSAFGRPVSGANQLLTQVERLMDDQVTTRHGARASDARCYFAATPAASTSVTDRVFCGPVRFIDSDPARSYLTYNLTSVVRTDGSIRFTAAGLEDNAGSPDPRPQDVLVRPDGKVPSDSRPADPEIPAAVGDVLTTTATLRTSLTPAPSTAKMVGQVSGVRLVEYGFVASYGWGDRARTAPPGYRLLAFATEALPGEVADEAPVESVRVDGVARARSL